MQRIFRRQTWWSIHVIYKSCLGGFYVSKKASLLIPNLSMHGLSFYIGKISLLKSPQYHTF